MANNLTEDRIIPLIIRMTIPMIMGMFSMMAFNLVDTYFIGSLGSDELSAISYTFPVVMIIGSIAMGLGIGSSSVISRYLGRGDASSVKRIATDVLFLSLIIVLVISLAGSLTIYPLFRLLGAEEELLPLIAEYMQVWYIGIIFVVIPMVGNGIIRATGDTRFPALIMSVAAICNALLDPILIFGLGPVPAMGLRGAALASLGSRFITLAASLYVLVRRENLLVPGFEGVRRLLRSWAEVLHVAVPSMATNLLTPVTQGIIIRIISEYGKYAVAGIGVSTRVESFGLIVIMAMTSALGPVVGQNQGAGREDRIRKALLFSAFFSLAWGGILLMVYRYLGREIAVLFTEEQEVIKTIVIYLNIVAMSYGFQGIFRLCSSALNAMGRPIYSSLLHILRLFVLYLPLALILNRLTGMEGIFHALLAANLVSGSLALFITLRLVSRLER